MHSLEANGIALMSHSSDRLVASILSEPNNIPYALDLLPGHHCKRQVAAGRVASLHRNKRPISSVLLKELVEIRHHIGSSGRWQQRDVHSRVRSRMRRCPPSATCKLHFQRTDPSQSIPQEICGLQILIVISIFKSCVCMLDVLMPP